MLHLGMLLGLLFVRALLLIGHLDECGVGVDEDVVNVGTAQAAVTIQILRGGNDRWE
jgi:hypothetical protein